MPTFGCCVAVGDVCSVFCVVVLRQTSTSSLGWCAQGVLAAVAHATRQYEFYVDLT